MTKILGINDFINESQGARLMDRTPDRFNSDTLANKKPNNILDIRLKKQLDYTEKELKKFCSIAYDDATRVFDEYITKRYADNTLMVFPDGCGDYFRFIPNLEIAYDDEKYETGTKNVAVAANYKILMDVGGVIFNDGLNIIDMVTDAVKNRYRHQMGLVLADSNYDDDEDRMMGFREDNEKAGMFFISDEGLSLFEKIINQHNGGDYSNDDYEIKVTAYKHKKYNNVVIEIDVYPTLNNYDMANEIYQNLDDKNKNEQYAKEFGTYIGEIFSDIFSRASDEYENVLK